jgi:hypothetical protein
VNGGWGLSQSRLTKLKNADYKGAADEWLARHKPGTVICLVQFQNAKFEEMPRIYLATPHEVATKLRDASGGRGDTVLWENYTCGPKAQGAGTIERLPDEWRLSETRVNDLLLI